MIVDYCHLSEAGPRARNEDSLGVWLESPNVQMAAIADGLGGLHGGAVASQLAISEIERLITSGDLPSDDLHGIFNGLHEEIIQAQTRSAENRAMATTLSFIQIEGGALKGAHVGDTRVMVARRNGIKRLTQDQTEAWRLLQGGLIDRSDYRTYPRKNVLYSALGAHRGIEVQEFSFDILSGDFIILTSDGIHQLLSMSEFRDIAKVSSTCAEFVGYVRREIEGRMPSDNFSIIVLRV
ncbi:PP2C family protein-serine/threonine phosphatase [Stenotrophomonas forensis]